MNETASATVSPCTCAICGYHTERPAPHELGTVRGNTPRFMEQEFTIWKCPRCGSLHSLGTVDYADIYHDYPLNQRRLDIFARGTLRNLRRRLEKGGLRKTDRILDYGCGNGVLLQYLADCGYTHLTGYDPYVPQYSTLPAANDGFDAVILNDTLEHTHDPRGLFAEVLALVRPGGLFYAGTADSDGVTDMSDLDPHIMRLHQPYHRVIFNQQALLELGREHGLETIQSWRRSYMDTAWPFASYRFLDEFNAALGHDMARALDPSAGKIMLSHPGLWFWALFGYVFPSAYEPAALWRKPVT